MHTKPSKIKAGTYVEYKAGSERSLDFYKWRSPIFMPRWASRITLEIAHVRMERVQEIRVTDLVNEGGWEDDRYLGSSNRLRYPFIDLWNSKNAKRGYPWDSNPWVWVVEFRKVEVQNA